MPRAQRSCRACAKATTSFVSTPSLPVDIFGVQIGQWAMNSTSEKPKSTKPRARRVKLKSCYFCKRVTSVDYVDGTRCDLCVAYHTARIKRIVNNLPEQTQEEFENPTQPIGAFIDTHPRLGNKPQTILTWAREAHGLTLAQVAEMIGKSRSAVGHYESGETCPSVEIAHKLAALYGIDFGDIVTEEGVGYTRATTHPNDLRKARERQGLSLVEVGKLINVSYSTVFSYETGEHRPKPATVRLLAEALNMTVREVVAACKRPPKKHEERLTAALNAIPEDRRERAVTMFEDEVDRILAETALIR